MHAAQELVVDRVTRRRSEDRVEAAPRAQRGLVAVDPLRDLARGELPEAEEAPAVLAREQLGAVTRGVGAGFDAVGVGWCCGHGSLGTTYPGSSRRRAAEDRPLSRLYHGLVGNHGRFWSV